MSTVHQIDLALWGGGDVLGDRHGGIVTRSRH